MVYRGFGDFSIILYIYQAAWGVALALPFGFPLFIAENKKVIPQNKP
jgi:ABC-type phosphate/phosphonate transport system permease subunit